MEKGIAYHRGMHRSRSQRSVRGMGLLTFMVIALGCSNPEFHPAVDTTVRMTPVDMVTNLPSTPPLVISIPTLYPWTNAEDFAREELPSWRESMRVVRWPSREPVAGRWVFSNALPVSFTFMPTASFPRGWYAIQVNFGTIVVPRATTSEYHLLRGTSGQYLDDGWTTARFHVGSLPIVLLRGGADVPRNGYDGGGNFRLNFSEEITFENSISATDLLRVSVNGIPLRCDPYSTAIQGGRFLGASWSCETPASEGTVRAELMPLPGASLPLRYGGESGSSVWVSQTGESFEGPFVDDSIFVEEGL